MRTVHGYHNRKYSCTHHSILTIHIVSTSMVPSGCCHVGELLLGSGDVVNLDSGDGLRPSVLLIPSIPSAHHHCVLQLNSAGIAANKEKENY